MRREPDRHKTNDCNRQIEVQAGPPGVGGAPIRYDVFGPRRHVPNCGMVPSFGSNIKFHEGPVADGVNGWTNEVMLAIVEDRLMGFQSGPYACEENNAALFAVRSAQAALNIRTANRLARGVEGTHKI